MKITTEDIANIIAEELQNTLDEKCWDGYVRNPKVPKGERGSCKAKTDEAELAEDDEVEKDACYHKVKANSKEWPSAYASGRLVQCRDKGADNWNTDKTTDEGKQSSEDAGKLKQWFGRKGPKGPTGGWVDCKAPDGEGGYQECAQGDRKKEPYCRPTPSACRDEPQKDESLGRIVDEVLDEVYDELEEKKKKKKKKPCKKAKGKKFVKRVNGRCRSYGQSGKAKDGGARIRPGTKKGDAYCARSAKIKKCKNPPCANALSRKKWKCRGSKSMKEECND